MKMNDIQNEVKKLIKDHVKTNSVTKEIDSPYAKYNSRGQLMCIVCGVHVKSKIIWQAHINKRSHKETLQQLKEKQEKISRLQYQKAEKKGSKKRDLSPDSLKAKHPNKHIKVEKPKGILKNIATYSSSEGESEDESNCTNLDSKNIKTESSIKQELPDNFFDQDPSLAGSSQLPTEKSKAGQKDAAKSKASASDVLPEGFFDDPVADAKARNVEYRDKDAEEWESFMKEVSAAEVVSQQIIAEDKEEAAFETQLEQADEQIKCLERIVELDKAKQTQLSKKNNAIGFGSDAESSDEEFSPVIWRTKNSLI